jgi:Ca2+-binding EF-hand superfamily protein
MDGVPSAYAEQIRAFQESFQLFDLDRNGTIAPHELQQVMVHLGQPLTREQALEIVQGYDVNGDGQIEFAEFLMYQLRSLREQPEPLRAAFAAVDTNRDGYVERGEMKTALALLWEGRLTDAQMDKMIGEADHDKDGRVTLAELVALVMRAP